MVRRSAFGEWLMSAGALAIIVLALVAIDDRVREQVSLRWSATPSSQLSAAGSQVRNLTEVVFEAARDQSIAHAPLLLFGLGATVLVVFMLRT